MKEGSRGRKGVGRGEEPGRRGAGKEGHWERMGAGEGRDPGKERS